MEKGKRALDISKCPLKHRWDFRTGSPQRVFRAISDALEDTGYAIEESQPPELKSSPITDTATFTAEAIGRKRGFASIWYVVEGMILVGVSVWGAIYVIAAKPDYPFTINIMPAILLAILLVVIFALGLALISVRKWVFIRVFVRLEGEAYKAAAKTGEGATATDVICDTRLTIAGAINFWLKDRKAQAALEADFREIQKRVEAVLPSFVVAGNAAGFQAGVSKERPAYWTDIVRPKKTNKN